MWHAQYFRVPVFGALVPVAWCLSYAFTVLAVGSSVGRQSSTSGIAPFLSLLATLPLALVGSALGRILRHMLSSSFRIRWTRPMRWCAPLVLAVVAAAASRHASQPIYAAERAALPRVIVNTVQLRKRAAALPGEGIRHAARVYDYLQRANSPIPWDDGSAQLVISGDTLVINFRPGGGSMAVPLPGIDYVNYVDAVSLRDANGRPALALLITGRATGRRDLLAVVSASGELVYLELLERFWNFRSVPLAVAASSAGDLIVVGSDPGKVLLFGLR
jgi:hypothetical protein